MRVVHHHRPGGAVGRAAAVRAAAPSRPRAGRERLCARSARGESLLGVSRLSRTRDPPGRLLAQVNASSPRSPPCRTRTRRGVMT